MRRLEHLAETELVELPPDHHERPDLSQRLADRLRDERHGARCTRVHLDHIRFTVLDRILHVHQPAHTDLQCELLGRCNDVANRVFRERVRRQRARAVTRMHTGLLDVLHDPADDHTLAVADGIDVYLDRVRQETVDQYRVLR